MSQQSSSTPTQQPFVVEIPQRWGDLDAQGHVNNALVTDYLQEARVDFLFAGDRAAMLDTGVVVAAHQVEYRAPIMFGAAPLSIELAVLDIGASRFRLGYRLLQQGRLMARARSTMCPVELPAQRPRRLTADERGWFEQFLSTDEPFRDVTRVALAGRGHVHEVRPRWSDVDRYDHVNNVRIFDYVQEARIAMTTSADPSTARSAMPGADTQWLVARQDVDYLGSLRFRMEPYHVITSVVGVGTTSMTLNAEIVDPLDEGRVLCRAATVLVCGDARGNPKPLTDDQRRHLLDWLVE